MFCEKCGAEIDDKAVICVKCGAGTAKPTEVIGGTGTKMEKKFYQRWWFWVIAVVVVIALANSVGGNSNTKTTDSGTKAKTGTTETTVKDVYNYGETAELEGANITVKKVSRSNGSTYNKPEKGEEFVIVTVKITNTSDKTINYNVYDYKLQDGNGNIESQDISAAMASEKGLSSGELAAGGTKTGTIAFSAPKNDKNLVLIYEGNFWSSKQLKFKLK